MNDRRTCAYGSVIRRNKAMMRSLFSGVAGLKTHQTKMDVIGNNIANVNTVGYKAQSVSFSDVLYQTTQSASGPNAESGRGGTNAMQIGLGSKVAAMSTSVSDSGGAQSTNNPFDLMINGDSMFIVSNGTENFFTRAGNFTTDGLGNLVTSAGYSVMGWLADDDGNIQRGTVRPLSVYSSENTYVEPTQTLNTIITGNLNKEDESFSSAGGTISTNISFYDNLGYEYRATISITQTDDYNYSLTCTGMACNGEDMGLTDAQLQAILNNAGITFSQADGSLTATTPASDPLALTLNVKSLGDSFAENITVDVSKITCYGKDTSLVPKKGDASGERAGAAAGKMSSVSIQTDGKIIAGYDNGASKVLGQIVVATFTNLAGLEKAGANLYSATMNSGEFDGIGQDVTADGGSFSPGYVEMSNVDLAGQFTDMITTQRGFQANSRIITVSDTMLEELINLKR